MFTIPACVRHWLPLLGLIWITAFFRLHNLDNLPPGLHHDEAFNGLDALHLARTGDLSIFYADNNGREPLHIYLQAAAIALLGSRPWTLRLVSALAGIVTIPLVYSLARDLFRGSPAGAQPIALLAAGSLALGYWHVNFSRIAFRAIFMLPLLTLGLWLFWRGWQRHTYRAFAGSGLAFGLSLYTYLPARLFPLLLAGFLLFLVLLMRRPGVTFRSSWLVAVRGSALTGLVALLVFVPLGAYFLAHPADFGTRSQQVSIFTYAAEQGQPLLQILADNLWATGRMLVDRGHENPVLNLPGRPALDTVALLGFLIGLALALARLPEPPYALLLLWLIVMLSPTYLSNEPAHPLRAIGVLPPVSILTGAGLQRLWMVFGRYQRRPGIPLWPLYLGAVLALSGWLTYRDYFQRWSRVPEVVDYFDVAEAVIARRIVAQSNRYDFFLPAETYEHPTTRYLLASALPQIRPSSNLRLPAVDSEKQAILLYPQNRCRLQKQMVLFQRAPGNSAAVTILHTGDLDVAGWLAPDSTSRAILDQRGIVVARELAGVSAPQPVSNLLPRVIGANLDHSLCLLGYDLQPAVPQPGEAVRLVLYAEVLRQSQPLYEVIARLEDVGGSEVARFGRQSLPLAQAGMLGDIEAGSYEFILPRETGPGKHRLWLELFPLGVIEPLPVVDRRDLPVALATQTEYLTLAVTVPDPSAITHQITILAGDPPVIRLLGYNGAPATAVPGQLLDLDLYWQALQPMARNYTVFVHLLDEVGQVQVQQDAEPMAGRAPTSLWLVPEIIPDRHTLSLDPVLAEGEYRLSVGLYEWQTGERLPLFTMSGERIAEDRLLLSPPISVVRP